MLGGMRISFISTNEYEYLPQKNNQNIDVLLKITLMFVKGSYENVRELVLLIKKNLYGSEIKASDHAEA